MQEKGSTSLDTFLTLFRQADSGQGTFRMKCLTHDTRKALIQTMEGLKAVCDYLLTTSGFEYVVLREIQIDRLEGEFGVYRQTTGANSFMTCKIKYVFFRPKTSRQICSFIPGID